VKLLPASRRARLLLAGGVLALLAAGGWWGLDAWRPWEPRFLGHPAAWWEGRLRDESVDVEVREQFPGSPVIWLTVGPLHRPGGSWRAWLEWAGVPVPSDADARRMMADRLRDTPGACPVLLRLLRSPHAPVRRYAAYCLGDQRPPDPQAARLGLWEALGDPDPTTRRIARLAWKDIDPDALAAYDREHPGARREGGE
jgi:hypothetical protein